MRRMQNLVNVAVRAGRNDPIQKPLNIHQNDPKKFWKHINEILPSKTNNQNYDNILNERQ